MNKKFFLLFVSVLALLFSVSSAMAAEFAYVLMASNDAEVEISPNDELVAGYNYNGKITLPKLVLYVYDSSVEFDEDTATQIKGFTASWDLVSEDHTGLKITERTDDYFVVKGILPDVSPDYSYKMLVAAKVASVTEEKYAKAVGVSTQDNENKFEAVEIAVEVDKDHTKATEADFKKYVVSYDKAKLETVSTDYSVTVRTLSDDILLKYDAFIASDDTDSTAIIDVPEWLVCTVNERDTTGTNEDVENGITSITISFNPAFKDTLKDGEKGTIHVPFMNVTGDASIVFAWNVTFSRPEEKKTPDDKKEDDKSQDDKKEQETPKAENITSKVALTDSNGASAKAKPYDDLEPGKSATYGISLANSGVIAKTWAVLINGVQSHTVTIAGFLPSDAPTSWVTITESTATTATVKATPPADLAQDSAISVLITDANNAQYTVDLGTVKKAATDDTDNTDTNNNNGKNPKHHSGGGCNAGLGSLALAFVAVKLLKRHQTY